jgi:hypothetical protein
LSTPRIAEARAREREGYEDKEARRAKLPTAVEKISFAPLGSTVG